MGTPGGPACPETGQPSGRIRPFSCPDPLWLTPFGQDMGLFLPEHPSADTLRPGYRSFPARTTSGRYPSAWISAFSCPDPLWLTPFGLDKGSFLSGPPLADTLRPGYRSFPARTRASGAGASSQSSHRVSLSAALGYARRRCPNTDRPQSLWSFSWTRSEPPRRVLRGGESPTRLPDLSSSHHTS